MFKNHLVKRAVVALLLVAFLPLLPSCTDDEVATGAAVVAVGAAAVSIGAAVDANDDNYDRNRRRPSRPRRRVRTDGCGYGYRMACSSYRDYYGRYHKTCQCVRDRYGYGYGYRAMIDVDETLTAEEYSVAYNMSLDAAKKFQNAIEEANNGNLKAINELGLSKKDMNLLARLRLPSNEGIDALAKNLDQDPIFARSMISKMVMFGREKQQELCEEGDVNYTFCK